MQQVTDQTNRAVWNTLCNLEWNVRYYTELAVKRRRYYWRLRYAILIGVLIDAGLFYIGGTYTGAFYAGLAVGVLLACGTIWDATSNYAEAAALARTTAYSCDDLFKEIERLWRDIEADTVTNEEAEARHDFIMDRWSRVTERLNPEEETALRTKTASESREAIENRYAT